MTDDPATQIEKKDTLRYGTGGVSYVASLNHDDIGCNNYHPTIVIVVSFPLTLVPIFFFSPVPDLITVASVNDIVCFLRRSLGLLAQFAKTWPTIIFDPRRFFLFCLPIFQINRAREGDDINVSI